MKTANEIQIEALAKAYDDLCFYQRVVEEDKSFETIRCQVDCIIEMLESEDYSREDVANYAKHFLDDIMGMIEERDQ